MANQFTVQGTPVFIAADPHPKRVSVFGDPVSYGDIGLTHDNARGTLKESKPIVLGTGQWIVSQGSSLVTVEEVPGTKATVNASQSKAAPVNESTRASDQPDSDSPVPSAPKAKPRSKSTSSTSTSKRSSKTSSTGKSKK